MITNIDFLNALLRKDFKSFVQKVFNEVSPNAEYCDNWHVDLICNELTEMINGKHDDQCDALSQLLGNPPKSTIFDAV